MPRVSARRVAEPPLGKALTYPNPPASEENPIHVLIPMRFQGGRCEPHDPTHRVWVFYGVAEPVASA